jgi:hypothetical protein
MWPSHRLTSAPSWDPGDDMRKFTHWSHPGGGESSSGISTTAARELPASAGSYCVSTAASNRASATAISRRGAAVVASDRAPTTVGAGWPSMADAAGNAAATGAAGRAVASGLASAAAAVYLRCWHEFYTLSIGTNPRGITSSRVHVGFGV